MHPPEVPLPDPYPDCLEACADKMAFLTDAVAGLAESQQRTDLSPRGLHGLWRYLSDLEQNLTRLTQAEEVTR